MNLNTVIDWAGVFDNVVDIKLDENGDIVIGEHGDLELVRGEWAIFQQIRWRIQTELGDWRLEPDCGTTLWRLAGAPNSEQTGQEIEAEVRRALTHDGFVPDQMLTIEVAPESEDSIAVFMLLEGMTHAVKFTYRLQEGVVTDWQYIQLTS